MVPVGLKPPVSVAESFSSGGPPLVSVTFAGSARARLNTGVRRAFEHRANHLSDGFLVVYNQNSLDWHLGTASADV